MAKAYERMLVLLPGWMSPILNGSDVDVFLRVFATEIDLLDQNLGLKNDALERRVEELEAQLREMASGGRE
jgi:hypothetical protein